MHICIVRFCLDTVQHVSMVYVLCVCLCTTTNNDFKRSLACVNGHVCAAIVAAPPLTPSGPKVFVLCNVHVVAKYM